MQIHQVTRKTKLIKSARVGRGGKRGKTSGRGTKGQLARSGHKLRPELRDIIKKIPKLRGRGRNYNTPISIKPIAINLAALSVFASGEVVSPKTLAEKKVISFAKGKNAIVKILATGDITTKLNFENCLVSESAKAKIEKAGGKIA